jgi:hypothetical protein
MATTGKTAIKTTVARSGISVEVTANPEFEGAISAKARALLAGLASDYVVEVRNRMVTGPATGRIYASRLGRGMHQASAPGEPPAPDTRDLIDGIAVVMGGRGMGTVAQVVVADPARGYVLALEFGTSRMLPRPVWLPALDTIAARLKTGS